MFHVGETIIVNSASSSFYRSKAKIATRDRNRFVVSVEYETGGPTYFVLEPHKMRRPFMIEGVRSYVMQTFETVDDILHFEEIERWIAGYIIDTDWCNLKSDGYTIDTLLAESVVTDSLIYTSEEDRAILYNELQAVYEEEGK